MRTLPLFSSLFTGSLNRRSRRQQSATRLQPVAAESLEVRALMTASSLLAANSTADNDAIARIVNGTVTTQYPSVGMVGDTSGFYGSGTLIGSQYVLTAGHCAEGVANTAGRFQIGNTVYSTSQVFLHPNYNANALGSDSANDIAIFKLDRPVTGVTPSPIYRSIPAVGQLLTLVGFGGGGTGTSGHDGSFGTKRVGTTPIDQVSSKLISWNFDNNSESNTAPGDSGGPAFLNVGGVYYVAGVTSGGDLDTAGIGDHSFDTRVDAFAAWIDSIVGSVTNPSTVVSIKAGDANAAETATGQTANPGSWTITRTGSTTSALTVKVSMSGTATNGTDYNSIPTTVTIPAGAASATVTLTVKDDAIAEGNETAIMTVASGTGYSIDSANGAATVTIADNDAVTSNDKFANRRPISGALATVTGSNIGATKETGEPNVLGVSGGKSVWWTWTAPASGTVTLSTAGSSFDTTLGVYRGTAVNGLTLVKANDDENTNNGVYTSKLTFSAVKGQTYQILVDGYQGESGSIKLALDQPAGRKLSASKSTPVAASQSANAIVSGSVTSDGQSHRAAIRQQHRAARWQAATNRADSSASSSRVTARSSVTADVDAVFAGCLGSLLDN
ncbi:MAG: trypsin-like serine protease [Planctomycetaceae bacterium]